MIKRVVLILLAVTLFCPSGCRTEETPGGDTALSESASPRPNSLSWICPVCQNENEGNYCTRCGEKRPDSIVCPVCGAESAADGKHLFCGNCGASLTGNKPTGYPTEPQQANDADSQSGSTVLPGFSMQNIVPFRDGLLYDDGTNLYHMSAAGKLRWSFPVGREMKYSAGPSHVAVWSGARLMLVDQNGNATYSDTLEGDVQFVRVGERYIAVVLGGDTSPKLSIKNMEGGQEDSFSNTYDGLMLLDAGFFGDQGQYLWTLALDVFGTASNTILNTFQVGKMNYGQVSLGSDLTYKVIYENSKLRVFTTQQVYTYDYRCVQDSSATMLVYGWKLIDSEIPDRGRARLLLAPTSQTSGEQEISELRVLDGDQDRRYTLPANCVGACVYDGNVYAVSGNNVYRADMKSQKFFGYQVPGLENESITAYYGVTTDGIILVSTSAGKMYSVTLPLGD